MISYIREGLSNFQIPCLDIQNVHIDLRNISKISLPIIALVGMSSLPVAESGPVAWAACIAACEATAIAVTAATGGAGAFSLFACTQACWGALAAPVP